MPTADLSITVDDGTTTVVPGTSNTYTITVSNNGPDAVTGASVLDETNPVIGATWTAVTTIDGVIVGSPTGGSGPIAQTVDLPVGGAVIFTLVVVVDPAAPGGPGLSNIASVRPPSGTGDPNGNNNLAQDNDTLTPQADLAVTIDDHTLIVVPGASDDYTITVTNNGPSTVSSLTLSDAIPAALLNPNFAPSVGAYDAATGVWSGLSLATGQNVSMTLTGTIDPNATGAITNTVTVAPPAGTTDSDLANNTATDTDALPPILTTAASAGVTLSDAAVTLSDSATLSQGLNLTGNIVFTLTGPGGFSSTQTDAVNGDGTYTAAITLPTAGAVVGAYVWHVAYSGNNNPANAPPEQTTVSPASPALSTTASPGGSPGGT